MLMRTLVLTLLPCLFALSCVDSEPPQLPIFPGSQSGEEDSAVEVQVDVEGADSDGESEATTADVEGDAIGEPSEEEDGSQESEEG